MTEPSHPLGGAARGRLDGGGLFFLAVGVLSVGAAAILVRLAAAPALTTTWLRLALGGALLLVVARGLGQRFPGGRALRRAGVAGVLLALHFALWIASLSRTTVTASVVLVCLQPVFVTVFTVLVWRERVARTVVAGIAVALLGALLIAVDADPGASSSSSSSSSSSASSASTATASTATATEGGHARGSDRSLSSTAWGNALALGGAVAIALYVMALKRRPARGDAVDVDIDIDADADVLATSAVVTVVAALAALPVCVVAGEPLLPSSTSQAVWLLALALGPQVLGHTALNAALRRLPAPVVSGAILGEPVIASALAYALLDERVGIATAIGAAITIAGLVLLLRPTASSSSTST